MTSESTKLMQGSSRPALQLKSFRKGRLAMGVDENLPTVTPQSTSSTEDDAACHM